VPWSINPLIRLHWRGWDAEAVAFEAVSGEMAVVDALQAAVIGCFEAGPRDLQSLTKELAADIGREADADLASPLRAIIEDFVARGWLLAAEPM
jgi:hypothetical protein